MKPITLHPVSVLVGLALAGLVAISTGAAQSVQPIPTRALRVLGYVPADQWTFVRVETSNDFGGAVNRNFMVPTDRHFVVTMYQQNFSFGAGLLVNGITDSDTNTALGILGPSHVHETKVVFPPGTTLSFPPAPGGEFAWASLWGYLEPL